MILYIDETENDEYFIVAGVLFPYENEVGSAFKSFKKKISGMKLGHRAKSKIFMEFKSSLIDRRYQRIKNNMLTSLCMTNASVVYACHAKKHPHMNQVLKESVYITLLSSILSTLETDTDVVFDGFGKADFEEKIVCSANKIPFVKSISPANSQQKHGLQFADNVCSSIRLHISCEDSFGYFDIIKDRVTEVV